MQSVIIVVLLHIMLMVALVGIAFSGSLSLLFIMLYFKVVIFSLSSFTLRGRCMMHISILHVQEWQGHCIV